MVTECATETDRSDHYGLNELLDVNQFPNLQFIFGSRSTEATRFCLCV